MGGHPSICPSSFRCLVSNELSDGGEQGSRGRTYSSNSLFVNPDIRRVAQSASFISENTEWHLRESLIDLGPTSFARFGTDS